MAQDGRVAHPCVPSISINNRGCPTRRALCDGWVRFVHRRRRLHLPLRFPRDPGPQTLLWRRPSALHHLQLLPASALAGDARTPQPFPESIGTGAPPLSVRGRRLRGHARTLSFVDERARAPRSLSRHASREAGIRQEGTASAALTSQATAKFSVGGGLRDKTLT